MNTTTERTHGTAVVYGYSDDRRTLRLRDEEGNEVEGFGYYLDSLREQVIELWQQHRWLTWDALTAEAQDRLLCDLDEVQAEAIYLDLPFAFEQAQWTALDSYISFDSLNVSWQRTVDEQVREDWEAAV